jgi:hypothetical protein
MWGITEMLGMKGWFETRWKLLFVLTIPLIVFVFRHGSLASTEDARRMMGSMSFFSVFAAIYLAGAGIKTQPAFQQTKGLSGSVYFTLSLPVSRFRLLAARTGIGLLEFASFNVVIYSLAWILFPLVRGDSKPANLLELILASIVCSTCFYFASVLLATFLEDVWQVFGSMFVYGVVQWFTIRFHLASSFNLAGFAGDSSPLITHRLPWSTMTISVFLSLLLFSAALKIVRAREY